MLRVTIQIFILLKRKYAHKNFAHNVKQWEKHGEMLSKDNSPPQTALNAVLDGDEYHCISYRLYMGWILISSPPAMDQNNIKLNNSTYKTSHIFFCFATTLCDTRLIDCRPLHNRPSRYRITCPPRLSFLPCDEQHSWHMQISAHTLTQGTRESHNCMRQPEESTTQQQHCTVQSDWTRI